MKHVVIVHDQGNQQPTLTNRYQQKVQQKAQAKLLNFSTHKNGNGMSQLQSKGKKSNLKHHVASGHEGKKPFKQESCNHSCSH